MFKLFIASFLTGSVLIAGLASCSKEETQTITKVPDVYHPPPPEIESGELRVSTKTASEQKSRNLDFRDTFDFSNSHPAKTVISSICKSTATAQELKREVLLSKQTKIKIWQTLDPQVLYFEPEKELRCEFIFTLFNENGSSRTFPALMDVGISEKLAPEVRLQRNGRPLENLKFTTNEAKDIGFYAGPESLNAQLLCATMRPQGIRLFANANVNNFDLGTVRMQASQPLTAQLCRIQVSGKDSPLALSSRFQLSLSPLKPLHISLTPRFPGPKLTDVTFAPLITNALSYALAPVAQVRLTNPDSSARIVDFKGARQRVRVGVQPAYSDLAIVVDKRAYQLVLTDTLEVPDRILLNSGDQVDLTLVFLGTPLSCPERRYSAISFDQLSPFVLVDKNERDQTIGVSSFSAPPLLWYFEGSGAINNLSRSCDWPDQP